MPQAARPRKARNFTSDHAAGAGTCTPLGASVCTTAKQASVDRQRSRATQLLASLEAFALAELACLGTLGSHTVRYVSQNRAHASTRNLLFLAPVLAALVAYSAVPLLLARRPAWTAALERAVRVASPLLVLCSLNRMPSLQRDHNGMATAAQVI